MKYVQEIQERHADGLLVLPGEARSLAIDTAETTNHRSAAARLNGLFVDLTNTGADALGVAVSYGERPDAHVSVGIFSTDSRLTDKTFLPDISTFMRRLGPLFTFRYRVLHVADVGYNTVTQVFGRKLTDAYAPGESSIFVEFGRR